MQQFIDPEITRKPVGREYSRSAKYGKSATNNPVFSDTPMTRRTFANLLYGGLLMSFGRARRASGITSDAATDEVRRLGYPQWLKEKGRVA